MKKILLILLFISSFLSQTDTVYIHQKNTKISDFLTELFVKNVELYEKLEKRKVLLKTVDSSEPIIREMVANKKFRDKIVCTFGLTIGDYGHKKYSFSRPVLPVKTAVLTRSTRSITDSTVFDGFAYVHAEGGNPYYKNLLERMTNSGYTFRNIVIYDDYKYLVPALLEGKVDYIFGDTIEAWLEQNLRVVVEVDKELYFIGFLYAYESPLKKKFDKIFKYYLNSHAFYKLLTKHFGKEFRHYYKVSMK
jgi:hypothetical protein